jgi:hypothetical protein
LSTKPWVKTSLAPGSKVVTDYLKVGGFQDDLDKLGFNLVGYGCTTCIGNSGPLPDAVEKAISDGDLTVASVLSGNRNFEGRVHPLVKTNWLASPPLVVAYALAGNVRWITEAGGVAVLAHPRKYQLTATKLRELTADFRRAGGQAIEVSTSGQSSGDLGFLAELCRKEKLLASQGSDFHFPGAPWCELGRIMKMPDGLEPVWHSFRQPVPGAAPP